MISIQRLPEPEILKNNKEKWKTTFLEKRAKGTLKRPPSSQYAHQQIRDTLSAMSFGKCFYCESKLGAGKDDRPEIEHYIEIEDNPDLAFEWINLYLSCHDCNSRKLGNYQIPVSQCLDPCDLTENPSDHLTFDKEIIRSKNSSQKGMETIRKYRLDRDELDYLRRRQLMRLYEVLIKLQQLQITEGRKSLTDSELQVLMSFKQADHAFSLMFGVYLNNPDLNLQTA